MYNSQYYTCEQIDQRLLQGYLDDYNTQNNTNLTKAEFLTLLFNTVGRNNTIDNLVTQVGYYECDTAAGTAAKAITVANYNLFAGGSMKVKFVNKNTANNATLNINSQGAKALYYQGERASSTNSWNEGEVVEIYYDGTNYYANNVKGGSGSGVYDVSVEHPTSGPNGDGKFTLEYILNPSNVNELIPVNKRYQGMSIQFVSTYDNKYVQYRLMNNQFSTTVSDWQGVDDEPTDGSDNLVKSSGVFGEIKSINDEIDGKTPEVFTAQMNIAADTALNSLNNTKTAFSLPAGEYNFSYENPNNVPIAYLNVYFKDATRENLGVYTYIEQNNPITIEKEVEYVALYSSSGVVSQASVLTFIFTENAEYITGIKQRLNSLEESVGELGTELITVERNIVSVQKEAIYDVSAHNDNAVFESLQALLSSSNLNTLIPTSVRCGGMSIRFIHGSVPSSDNNKYVQYRYMGTDATTAATFTNVANWQGVDDEPISESKNLITSGGVYPIQKKLNIISLNSEVTLEANRRILTNSATVDVNSKEIAANFACAVVSCQEGDKFSVFGNGSSTAFLYCFIDSSGNRLKYLQNSQTPIVITAPAGTDKVVFNVITLYDYFIVTGGLDYIEIQNLKNNYIELEDNIGYSKIETLSGGVRTSTSTVNITPEASNSFVYAIADCNAGDKFTVFGIGSAHFALYCFIDSSGNKLELKQKTNKPIIITAPANASKVVFNNNIYSENSYYFYKGVKPDVSFDDVSKQLNITTPNEPIKLTHGYRILTNGTTVGSPEFYDGFACASINCSPGDKYTVWGSGSSTAYLYCFIDSSGNKLSYGNNIAAPTIIVAPANSARVVFNIIDLNDIDYGIYKGVFDYLAIEQLEDASINNWFNKTVFTFGDSITWYDGHEFGESHSESGQIAVGYQSYLRQLGCTVNNYGVSGYKMPQILDVIKSKSYSSCDCVTITCGANDFRATSIEALGEIATIGSQFDETTMIGSLQAAIEWLINTKPSLRIFLITPIKGFTYTSSGVWGEMPETYAQAFIDVGKLYSLPVCDWYHGSGINFLNKNVFIGDDETVAHYKLHPTNAGFRLMGETLRGFFSIR